MEDVLLIYFEQILIFYIFYILKYKFTPGIVLKPTTTLAWIRRFKQTGLFLVFILENFTPVENFTRTQKICVARDAHLRLSTWDLGWDLILVQKS